MKLLLTSTGFLNNKIGKKFIEIIGKPPSKIKIIFVPTASRTKEELVYVDEAKLEIIELGVLEKNIKVLHLDHPISYTEVKDFDVIYICGGNTFYLLDRVRKTGFDKVIQRFFDNGKLYVGVSAGSIIVCPSIEIAVPFDENDVGMQDFRGLNLINVVLSPHYTKTEEEIIREYRKKLPYKIIGLTDKQAYIVLDKKLEIIQ